MRSSELDALRQRAIKILVISAWLHTAALALIGWSIGSPDFVPTLILALLANIIPTMIAMRGLHHAHARVAVGSLVAIHPALLVYLTVGHPWQADGHMFFFVALASLVILYDWRPIVIGSALIVVHHVLLGLIVPDWVFAGSGNFNRVAIHGLAVFLQCSVLVYLTIQMRDLHLRQDEARERSDQMAVEAIDAREKTEQALRAVQDAETREAQERGRRELLEREAVGRRRDEMLLLADAFQASVADIVDAVREASIELEASAHDLNDLARSTNRRSAESALAASRSSETSDRLAHIIHDLSASITSIATTVEQQAMLSGSAQDISSLGHAAVGTLSDRTLTISGFANSIQNIAARTNLLALNATIEAARAGDVGRGFAVVAGEVKQLAGQATGATSEIRTLVESVKDGADQANGALASIAGMVGELAQAAEAIRQQVHHQRETATTIEQAAREAANGAQLIVHEIGGIVQVASDTESLSGRVSHAASGLSTSAQALQAATDCFVSQLKAA